MKITTTFWAGLLLAGGLPALSGCAALPAADVSQEAREAPTYTTGSNFGRRGPATSMTKILNKDDVEREAQALSASRATAFGGQNN